MGYLIMKPVNKLKGQKMIIIIAHRMNILKNCSKTFKVEDNKIYLDNSARFNVSS